MDLKLVGNTSDSKRWLGSGVVGWSVMEVDGDRDLRWLREREDGSGGSAGKWNGYLLAPHVWRGPIKCRTE